MPIVTADLEWRLTVNTGPGDSTAQPDPDDSIGGFMSTTAIVDATEENLFANLTGDQNAASEVHYRGVMVLNDHLTLALENAVVWISAEVAGGADAAIAVAAEGVVDRDSASTQIERITDQEDTPATVTFSAPTTKGTGLSLGTIPAQDAAGLWVRRTATDSAAQDNDGVTLTVEGDTAA